MTEAQPAPQAHGGLRDAELRALGIDPTALIDFSASVNPLGASPRALAALSTVDYSRYPDPDCTRLREAIAEANGVTPDEVLPGNGATELIYLIVRLFVHNGQRAIVFAPTFGVIDHACDLVGATLFPWHANPNKAFRWNFRNKPDVLRRVAPPLLYLCNPNNPTGVYATENEVTTLTEGLVHGPLLLDESYIAFVEDPWNSVPLMRRGRTLVLRSMTKDFGLAGLRLGYLLAAPEVIRAVQRLQPEWSVSASAQAAGIAALADTEHVRRGRETARAGLDLIEEQARLLGLETVRGAANFLLIRTGQAATIRIKLLERGFAVRDCTSFGLPDHIRVAGRQPEQCGKLMDVIGELLETQSISPQAAPHGS